MKNEKREHNILEEYHRLELIEIFERTRSLENLRFQVGTFAGTANFTLIGIAISFQKVGILLVAIGLPIMNLLYDVNLRYLLGALYFRGRTLETQYASDPSKAILHTYKPARPFSFYSSVGGFWMPIVVALIELAIVIRVWLLGWTMF